MDHLKQLIDWVDGQVKLLTIAVDPKGSEKLACLAVSQGITVSLDNQMAKDADLYGLVQASAVSLIHLANVVPSMLSRHERPIWAGSSDVDLIAMIITDGQHLPVPMSFL